MPAPGRRQVLPMGKRRRTREESPEAGIRGLRLEEIFREELNSILDGEVSDRDLEGSRVTMVELSQDGSRARVWVAVPNAASRSPREIEAAFVRATGFFRSRLCDALSLKRMPELRFRHDPAALELPPPSERS
jgi:ribosome-binding factor A